MKITKEEAFAIAHKTRDNGCCSQYGQTIIYLLDEIDRLNSGKIVMLYSDCNEQADILPED